VIRFGDQEVFPSVADDTASLERLAEYMRGDEVHIVVDLAIAAGSATVYGCDLSDGYVRINADYTT
jgi:glutamate N-acetyltransferase/amino-acid N-acetyltransferase